MTEGTHLVTALVVDDEPHARTELKGLIGGVEGWECIGQATNGPEAVEVIDASSPDVVFLDINMPGWSGLEVVSRVQRQPVVVFTTAYSQHAIAAFDLGAMDYLLKPFSEARFEEAVGRANDRLVALARHRQERLHEVILDGSPARRVFVPGRDGLVAVDADAIVRLEADGDYVRLYAGGVEYLIYTRLGELFSRFDPAQFLRVHRSHVVNLRAVRGLRSISGGRFAIEMTDGSTVLTSRRRAAQVRRIIL